MHVTFSPQQNLFHSLVSPLETANLGKFRHPRTFAHLSVEKVNTTLDRAVARTKQKSSPIEIANFALVELRCKKTVKRKLSTCLSLVVIEDEQIFVMNSLVTGAIFLMVWRLALGDIGGLVLMVPTVFTFI